MHPARTLALLSWWQVRNALRTTFTDPRKLIPLLVIVSVMGLNVLNFMFVSRMGSHTPRLLPVEVFLHAHIAAIHACVFALILLFATAVVQSGFTGGALTFALADIDYVFPAPIARRLVLAYRLPGITGKNLLSAAALLWVGYLLLWRFSGPGHGGALQAFPLFLCLFFWLAGYTNVAVALEIIFGQGRAKFGSTALNGLILVLIGWIFYTGWKAGLDGIVAVEHNPLVTVPFYPCLMVADAFLAPLMRAPVANAVWPLALFYAASLALVLAPNRHYYEATLTGSERVARVRQALRSGDPFAHLSVQRQMRGSKTKDAARPYTLPLFGRGAMALFWAHLAEGAKHPWRNWAAPFAVGAAVAVAALRFMPAATAWILPTLDGQYAYGMLVFASRSAFRQTVQRHGLIRPLPIPARKVVAADVLPVALSTSLFGWGIAVPLLVMGHATDRFIAGILLLVAPVALLCLALVIFTVSLWYPAAQDKLQQLLGGLVVMALLGILVAALTPVPAVLVYFHAAPAAVGVLVFLECLAAAAVLLALATRAYHRFQPVD